MCLGERMYSVELEAGEAAPRLTPRWGAAARAPVQRSRILALSVAILVVYLPPIVEGLCCV